MRLEARSRPTCTGHYYQNMAETIESLRVARYTLFPDTNQIDQVIKDRVEGLRKILTEAKTLGLDPWQLLSEVLGIE